ncbi:uncharacterized protein LOC142331670 [Lycorma delicatula]|uniref:uncharacterized protein LOC142331670 n=1 Tax=Lycorma delicatula TaxID=130591 RepID=UPI003F51AA45
MLRHSEELPISLVQCPEGAHQLVWQLKLLIAHGLSYDPSEADDSYIPLLSPDLALALLQKKKKEENFAKVLTWEKKQKEVTQIKTYSWDNAQVILVDNKCDMEDERVISFERGKQLAEQLGIEFFETSAKENVNVKVRYRLFGAFCNPYFIPPNLPAF